MSTPRAFHHLLSGATFPGSVPGFVTGEPTVYDNWGHDVSVGYAWPGDSPDTQLTAYVFPSLGASDTAHLEQSVASIHQFHLHADVLGHAQVTIKGHEGVRVDLLIDGKDGDAQLRASSILVFEVDGWFVKVRATASSADSLRPVGTSAEALLRHFGWPRRQARVRASLEAAKARAGQAMADLTQASLRGPTPGTAIEQGLAHLRDGKVMAALEQFVALSTEGDTPGADALERTLQAYMPADVNPGSGRGTSLEDPIVLEGAPGHDAWVAACYRYLDCLCGERPGAWDVDACDVVLAPSGLVDALRLRTASGQAVTVFLAVPDTGQPADSHGSVLATWQRGAGADLPAVTIPDGVPESLAEFLTFHLWCHTAQWLLTRGDSAGAVTASPTA